MAARARIRVIPTIRIDPDGHVIIRPATKTYAQGFGALFDMHPARTVVKTLPQGETARVAFQRVGAALRPGMQKVRAGHAD